MMPARGFTLLEVLLAMAITAMVAVVAYAGLSSAITAAERHKVQARRLGDIQLALTVIERDVRFAAPRAVTDQYGEHQAPMLGGDTTDPWLQLTRYGWDNPLDQPRGTLQRVDYTMQGEELWRESWPVLDRADEETGLQRVLVIDGVSAVVVRFLDGTAANAGDSELGGEWVDVWPSLSSADQLPLAVEITLELADFNKITRVYALAEP